MTDSLEGMKENIKKQKKISKEINSLYKDLDKSKTPEERNMISSQIESLKSSLKETNQGVLDNLQKTNVARPLNPQPQPIQPAIEQFSQPIPKKSSKIKLFKKNKLLIELEKETLKRIKKKEKRVVRKKIKKPSKYVKISNNLFSNFSRELIKKGNFKKIEKSIIRAKLFFIPHSYISIIFFTTLLSILASIFILMFLLFFNIGVNLPIITKVTEDIGIRFLKVFWVLFVIPIGTFLLMYLYPLMEEKSAEMKINNELPFATIHMAAISSSMIDPSKIFNIIVSTREYPYLEKEFTRLINEINIYGYDLISALKSIAFNSPSKKLTELLNGLATTISSGGNLPDFFEKRAETLLFDYKIEREKYTKSAETFMDMYISVVIAAPMILMLLLIMMRVSGLGLALSTPTITIMTVLGVFLVNIVFLTFLHLRKPSG